MKFIILALPDGCDRSMMYLLRRAFRHELSVAVEW